MNSDVVTVLLILALTMTGLVSFFNIRIGKKKTRTGKNDPTDSFPTLQLQAYERLILLMERMNPTELVLRYNNHADTVSDLQKLLLSAIRAETEHNYSQQLYVSNAVWEQIMAARNTVMNLINQSAAALQPSDPAVTLAKKVIDNSAALQPLPTHTAVKALKAEARKRSSQQTIT
jgi:hypothetical protein